MDKKIIDVAETCRRIKKLIEENKYTPREVQFKLGLESVQTVYKWYSSNNKTIPSLDSLIQLSELLGCSIEDILVLKDKNFVRRKEKMICKKCGSVIEEKPKTKFTRNIFEMGSYYYGFDESFGKKPIEWIPLDIREDGIALVIAREILDCLPYDEDAPDWRQTWENCTLRKWLNNEFLNEAFTPEEQEMIKERKNINKGCDEYETPGGNDTVDKIFLLSVEDVEDNFYLGNLFSDTTCSATQYARVKGVNASRNYSCEWWLRNPGFSMYGSHPNASIIRSDGNISRYGTCMEFKNGVRPAMVVDASKISM